MPMPGTRPGGKPGHAGNNDARALRSTACVAGGNARFCGSVLKPGERSLREHRAGCGTPHGGFSACRSRRIGPAAPCAYPESGL